jgi:hypothetical protein
MRSFRQKEYKSNNSNKPTDPETQEAQRNSIYHNWIGNSMLKRNGLGKAPKKDITWKKRSIVGLTS